MRTGKLKRMWMFVFLNERAGELLPKSAGQIADIVNVNGISRRLRKKYAQAWLDAVEQEMKELLGRTK